MLTSFVVTFSIVLLFISSESVFVYDIGARVVDFLSDFSLRVSSALKVPIKEIVAHNIKISINDPYWTSKTLLYPIILGYPNDVSDVLLSLQNGIFYAYSGSAFINIMLSNNLNSFYTVNADGSAGIYLGNLTFNPHNRPWYKKANVLKTSCWVGPFIANAQGNNPSMTLAQPIFESYVNKTAKNNNTVIGVLGANIYLTSIALSWRMHIRTLTVPFS